MLGKVRKLLSIFYSHNFNYNTLCELEESSCLAKGACIVNPSKDKSRIIIGRGSCICGKLLIWSNAGKISIGNYSFVGEGTHIYSAEEVFIGDRVQIAHNCNIFDSNIHSLDSRLRHLEFLEYTKNGLNLLHDVCQSRIVVDDDAWIGASATILKGVRIGKGAIVGAGSVVVHDVTPYTVVAGNPARVVKLLD